VLCDYLSGATVCGVVITYDDYICRSGVHPVGGSVGSLPALIVSTSLLMQSCYLTF